MPGWAAALALSLAALAGMRLARRFEGVSLPPWADGVALLMAGGLALAFPPPSPGALVWGMVLVLPLTALAAIDAATRRIPDLLSFLLILTGLGQTVISGGPVPLVALVTALLVLAGLASDWLLPDSAVGAGDLLLAAAAVAWVGLGPLLELLMIAAVLLWLHFLLALLLRAARPAPGAAGGVAMAPSLAVALAAVWLAGPG